MKAVVQSKTLVRVAVGAGLIAAVICWMNPPFYGDRPSALDRVEAEIEAFADQVARAKAQTAAGEWIYLGPTREQWLRMERVFETLTYPNVDRARAKTLQLLHEKPEEVARWDWEARGSKAAADWQMWSTWDLLKAAVYVAALAFAVVWVGFVVLAWAWYFVLDRVRELMAAARGEDVM
jgi:hypothetical protein